MFKEGVKVLDCTIRDGGLMNKWQFSDEFVRGVFDALLEAGIDYMEIGYISGEKYFSRKEMGPWKFCSCEDIKRVIKDSNKSMKLSAMADIGRVDPDDIPLAGESPLSMIRVACYAHQIGKAIVLADHCIDKGFETTINLMAVSSVSEPELEVVLNDLSKSKVPIFYLVDSFGSMHPESIQYLMKKYKDALPGKEIGIHTHNNMQLAMSNTVTALANGATRLDATLLGMGRGAGNCPIEILVAFLKNPRYRLLPLFRAIQEHILPMSRKIDWGYHIPYLITGALNMHPRSAIEWMESDKKDDFVTFMKSMHDY